MSYGNVARGASQMTRQQVYSTLAPTQSQTHIEMPRNFDCLTVDFRDYPRQRNEMARLANSDVCEKETGRIARIFDSYRMTLVPKENGRERDKTSGATDQSKGTHDGTTSLGRRTREKKNSKLLDACTS